ncbi:MAG TPA: TetR/AcrR family transcriptional regulator [Pseudonocardiaceae bacterium]|jgi:AcrR family transcriptional regulator|nr:TetR/AcrR family transcriptional regulator [Pseudonocardiaceae bacterium]
MGEEALPTKDRIVRAAAALLADGGRDAVSTRAVGAAAGVQAPTIYRGFGDMQGLLDAVASYGFRDYLRYKVERRHPEDPVDDLREGWDLHVGFGVDNPAFYILMYGEPRPNSVPAAALEAEEILHQLVGAVAAAGRLRVGVERAAQMVHSAGCGVTLTLIATKPADRDPELSTRVREAIMAAITTDTPNPAETSPASHAITLKAMLPTADSGLTDAEAALLVQWLDQIALRNR